ncbi:ABC transporter ATP-binding protein [Paenibacillus silvae]|uniref:ATP-binding cassette domain-containing protein n=1 Tax=Paenibacillus silvae TaxID=1325358 RepID=UPI00259FF243|nr:ABC transporter ATP-binding protein [Paenibacillus silvae]MDM5280847.1 ABC transporter ATP-binding protein [Paenibacillus silvae]
MIHMEHVCYSYQKNKPPILNNVTLHEHEPVIGAVWGRNGAGKTTLMSLLAGHSRPDRGTIQVMGQNPYNNLSAQGHLCYIQENHPLGKNWTIHDLLTIGSHFHAQWDQQLAQRLIEAFELPSKQKISKFSKGMKTAAQIILGLCSHASVTIMDEPTNGLDAEKRKLFYEALLETYEENPRLILISTHHIEEVQPLCESLIVVHQGNIFIHQPMEQMRERGVLLTGLFQDVEEAAQGAAVIESARLGKNSKVMIDDVYSKDWKAKAQQYGLSIEKASLQEYLVHVTRQQEGMKV